MQTVANQITCYNLLKQFKIFVCFLREQFCFQRTVFLLLPNFEHTGTS